MCDHPLLLTQKGSVLPEFEFSEPVILFWLEEETTFNRGSFRGAIFSPFFLFAGTIHQKHMATNITRLMAIIPIATPRSTLHRSGKMELVGGVVTIGGVVVVVGLVVVDSTIGSVESGEEESVCPVNSVVDSGVGSEVKFVCSVATDVGVVVEVVVVVVVVVVVAGGGISSFEMPNHLTARYSTTLVVHSSTCR